MFLFELKPLEDVLNIINKTAVKRKAEKINLEDAYNRVLAEDVCALIDSPSFDRSAMDGYAIRAEDAFGFSETNPAHMKIVDNIGAGIKSKISLKNGEAVKIATGAPIPLRIKWSCYGRIYPPGG